MTPGPQTPEEKQLLMLDQHPELKAAVVEETQESLEDATKRQDLLDKLQDPALDLIQLRDGMRETLLTDTTRTNATDTGDDYAAAGPEMRDQFWGSVHVHMDRAVLGFAAGVNTKLTDLKQDVTEKTDAKNKIDSDLAKVKSERDEIYNTDLLYDGILPAASDGDNVRTMILNAAIDSSKKKQIYQDLFLGGKYKGQAKVTKFLNTAKFQLTLDLDAKNTEFKDLTARQTVAAAELQTATDKLTKLQTDKSKISAIKDRLIELRRKESREVYKFAPDRIAVATKGADGKWYWPTSNRGFNVNHGSAMSPVENKSPVEVTVDPDGQDVIDKLEELAAQRDAAADQAEAERDPSGHKRRKRFKEALELETNQQIQSDRNLLKDCINRLTTESNSLTDLNPSHVASIAAQIDTQGGSWDPNEVFCKLANIPFDTANSPQAIANNHKRFQAAIGSMLTSVSGKRGAIEETGENINPTEQARVIEYMPEFERIFNFVEGEMRGQALIQDTMTAVQLREEMVKAIKSQGGNDDLHKKLYLYLGMTCSRYGVTTLDFLYYLSYMEQASKSQNSYNITKNLGTGLDPFGQPIDISTAPNQTSFADYLHRYNNAILALEDHFADSPDKPYATRQELNSLLKLICANSDKFLNGQVPTDSQFAKANTIYEALRDKHMADDANLEYLQKVLLSLDHVGELPRFYYKNFDTKESEVVGSRQKYYETLERYQRLRGTFVRSSELEALREQYLSDYRGKLDGLLARKDLSDPELKKQLIDEILREELRGMQIRLKSAAQESKFLNFFNKGRAFLRRHRTAIALTGLAMVVAGGAIVAAPVFTAAMAAGGGSILAGLGGAAGSFGAGALGFNSVSGGLLLGGTVLGAVGRYLGVTELAHIGRDKIGRTKKLNEKKLAELQTPEDIQGYFAANINEATMRRPDGDRQIPEADILKENQTLKDLSDDQIEAAISEMLHPEKNQERRLPANLKALMQKRRAELDGQIDKIIDSAKAEGLDRSGFRKKVLDSVLTNESAIFSERLGVGEHEASRRWWQDRIFGLLGITAASAGPLLHYADFDWSSLWPFESTADATPDAILPPGLAQTALNSLPTDWSAYEGYKFVVPDNAWGLENVGDRDPGFVKIMDHVFKTEGGFNAAEFKASGIENLFESANPDVNARSFVHPVNGIAHSGISFLKDGEQFVFNKEMFEKLAEAKLGSADKWPAVVQKFVDAGLFKK